MNTKVLKSLIGMVCFAMMAAASAMASDTVKIAYIDPLSGPFAAVGDSGYRHFQYNAELINAKGGVLGGKKLEIVAFDNKISAKESLIQLKNAIDQGIQIIIQGNGSSVAGALISAIEKHNNRNPDKPVVYLNFAAIDPAFTNEKCSFWHFRFDASVDMKIAAITDYIKETPKIKKVYLINQDYVFGHSVSSSAKAMLAEKCPKVEIVGDTFTPLGKVKDFSPYIAKIKASGADTIITGNWGADMSLLVKAGKDAGLNVRYLTLYGNGLGAPRAIAEAGIDKLVTVVEWHINLSVEENKPEDEKFFLDYQKKYSNDGEMPYYYGRARTTMEMLADAINKAGTDNPRAIAFALEGMEHDTPYGKVQMRSQDHQLIQPLYLAVYAKADGGSVKYDSENTGIGFKTIKRIEGEATAMPTTCQMERPEK
ncbi:MAG: branched-chain amino acid ABC transporter substrate-binding protein [Proteobacteria bacterium]|nr:branched-chain amino acid ABC transporter substrate-binding protein [Pseudomonadota bacterium]MBU1386764.1 branched-chain amino acid ABC transporter substrate-binding protein [Pseudomonadota bacterium]MBU1544708.1 branched-chain amino acid ABC transporter substrate-binding protein [Pseudomonadota bacterium]MBU2430114.1 branched-chain amino acid ABC transporter substrate-binding protein [Pseudomonadota bacterium]MBU2481873.1 branched-chain amino acid ABC transporter substrate-binding protein 